MMRERKPRLILVALVVVVSIFVVGALAGDVIQGFFDGLASGSNNGV